MFGGWAIGMRNMIIYELDADYSTLPGRARRPVQARPALRLPQRACCRRSRAWPSPLGVIVAGALVTEIVFSYPGIGKLLLAAVQNQDYFLLQGIFLFVIIGVLVANFLVDIAYVLRRPADPGRDGRLDGQRDAPCPAVAAPATRDVPRRRPGAASRDPLLRPAQQEGPLASAVLILLLALAVIGPIIRPGDPNDFVGPLASRPTASTGSGPRPSARTSSPSSSTASVPPSSSASPAVGSRPSSA